MAVVFDWWLTDLTLVIVFVISSIYLYFHVTYKYWKRIGVKSIPPTFPFGNIGRALNAHSSIVYDELYKQFKGEKVGGFYQFFIPTILLIEPETVKNMLVKDFNVFHDRGLYQDFENDPISNHLFFSNGPKWRAMRAKLTPTFTSGKMKMMFQTLLECGDELSDCLKVSASKGETVEMQDMLARYSTDVISSCAFGIQTNCLRNPDAEFRLRGRDFFHRDFLPALGFLCAFMAPSVAKFFKTGRTPKKVSEFFINAVKETVEYREKNNVSRKDFMQLLIQLKNDGFVESDNPEEEITPSNQSTEKLNIYEMAAQAFVFYLAGFETSSTTLTFSLYELALNPDIQTKLRQEIDNALAKHDGIISYDSMQEVEYLEKVISETLRKYPPVHMLNRVSNTSYKIPGSDIVLESGTPIVVPVYAIHHDPDNYPDPERFDPERFTKEAKGSRHHYSYLPFGEGPRNCIGARFGMMQTKIGLISLLKNYEFHVSEKTVIPIILESSSILMAPRGGVSLKIVARQN